MIIDITAAKIQKIEIKNLKEYINQTIYLFLIKEMKKENLQKMKN